MTATMQLRQQIRLHQVMFWRNPESAFFNFAMPLGVLLICGATSASGTISGRPGVRVVTLFVPGILAFAVVVVAYGNLAATLAVQRSDGLLKRVRATPINANVYLGGQVLSVITTALLIAAATIGLGALAFGAVPRLGAAPALLLVLTLGVACFAALGVAISAAIRSADAAGVITNGTYLPLAVVSGLFTPGVHLPAGVNVVIGLFPLKALADGLRFAYDPAAHHFPISVLIVLGAWTVGGVIAARHWFRWQP